MRGVATTGDASRSSGRLPPGSRVLLLGLLLACACRPAADAARPSYDRTADAHHTAQAFNRFGYALYDRIADEEPGDVVISPVNVAAALTMAASGACGATLQEMAAVLHLDELRDADASAGVLIDWLNGYGEHDGIGLHIANAMWAPEFDASPFLARMKAFYHTALFAADLARDRAGSQAAIDRWVAGETNGRITHLDAALTDQSALVLTSAMYFKGDWKTRFEPSETHNEPFVTPSGPLSVPMMHRRGTFAYTRFDGGQAVELPYRKALSMIILLPDASDRPPALEAVWPLLRAGPWSNVLVDVKMPRWVSTRSTQLEPVLQHLGIKRAFDPFQADFCRISSRLFIDSVTTAAFINVDERGTEAASGAAVTFGYVMQEEETPISFWADRPFVYVIRDRTTGADLLIGRLVTPR